MKLRLNLLWHLEDGNLFEKNPSEQNIAPGSGHFYQKAALKISWRHVPFFVFNALSFIVPLGSLAPDD